MPDDNRLRQLLGWVVVILVAAAIAIAAFHTGYIAHWLAVHLGIVNESGPYYGFWSGSGSDIGELTLFATIIGAWRHVNCHSKGCWRFGKVELETEHGTVKVCRKCHPTHPDKAMTRAELHASHFAHKLAQQARSLETKIEHHEF